MLQIILLTEAEWNGIFFLGNKSVSILIGVKRVRSSKCAKNAFTDTVMQRYSIMLSNNNFRMNRLDKNN
jgi:hypothetical protein